MKQYESLISDHCGGEEWDAVAPMVQAEILAQCLRDEGFDACMAGVRQSQFLAAFTFRLADMVEARYSNPEKFAHAGRSFAAAACALVMAEVEKLVSTEWDDYCADWLAENTPDLDAPAEAQARYRDYVAVVRP